jgi:hypothetical protein
LTSGEPGNVSLVLRRALWSGILAAFTAGATVLARRTATGIWKLATSEEPPARDR